MILWTIQEEEIYQLILETGKYICDSEKSTMTDLEMKEAYDWLVVQMKERIGNPPEGVTYPVWAWYAQKAQHKKPDLRRERWCYGKGGEKFVCLEIEVPDEQVLLSDFNIWHIVLNDGLISESEEECDALYAEYEALSSDEKIKMKYENWKRVLDVSPLDNEWMRRGEWIQATFWVLTRDMIQKVRHFTAGQRKNND